MRAEESSFRANHRRQHQRAANSRELSELRKP